MSRPLVALLVLPCVGLLLPLLPATDLGATRAAAAEGAGAGVERPQRLPVLPRAPRAPGVPRTPPPTSRPTATPGRALPGPTPAPECGGRWHVRPDGSDAGPGDARAPFRTVQRAADVVEPGDTVCVAPGIYRERVRITRSGEPERPIVFQGASGAVVDGGDLHDDGWREARELGRNRAGLYPVWKKRIAFADGSAPYHATLDGAYLLRLRDHDNSGNPVMASCGERPASCRGGDLLRDGPSGTNSITGKGPRLAGWESPGVVDGFFGVDDGITYVAFKDGGSPNGRDLTFAPRNAGALEVRASWIVVRGFVVRGANYPIYLPSADAHHVTIEDNTVRNGFFGIFLAGGAHHNRVRQNDVSIAYAHSLDPTDQWHWFTWNAFRNMSELHRASISMSGGGDDNEIARNVMREVFGGVDEDGSTPGGDGVRVHGNVVLNALNDGLTITGGADSHWYDNTLVQVNVGARFWPFGNGASVRFYGNRIFQSDSDLVEACLFFFRGSARDELQVYNNSCSGPLGLLFGSTGVQAGLPKLLLRDNVFSVGRLVQTNDWSGWSSVFRDGARRPEAERNWASTPLPAWMGSSNRRGRARLWPKDATPDWSLDALDRVRPETARVTVPRDGSHIALPGIGAPPPEGVAGGSD